MNPQIAARLAAAIASTMLLLSACETMGVENAQAQPPAVCEKGEFSVSF